MLTEQRYEKILELLEQKESVTVMELKKLLGISDSTVRRDLAALDKAGKLVKVFGGAVRAGADAAQEESSADEKPGCCDEKRRIGKYAAGLLEPEDVIYMDAGTTVGGMIDFLTEKEITVVTNDIDHAKRLTALGVKTILTGGELREDGTVVGTDAVESVQKYEFSKGFFGTAGISLQAGFTARDSVEASIKEAAFSRCSARYILGDHTKLESAGTASFGALEEGILLTDEDAGEEFDEYTKVWRIN
ncbi:MAG TPA: DeoR/GlpR transcriptional regulator [Candidatus Egerieimonas faecigallinarum]|nr:DeoR/GlpR transcriptional regulator [Candidatus Egerieimonas faecigallinarum]